MTEYAIIISFLLSILVVGILFYFYRKWLIKNTDEDEVEKMTRKEILEKTIDFDDAINRIVRLEKENAELRKEWQEQVQKATDEGYARTLQTIQLNKATEIIKKLYAVYYDPCVTESDLKYRDELFAEVKQFLNSEVEK